MASKNMSNSRPVTAGKRATSAKRGFDYKMSKKVAELTQVVHMLFTKNHEKEFELELTRNAYEKEIVIVIEDAKSRIKRLEKLLSEEKRKSESVSHKLKREYDLLLKDQMNQFTQEFTEKADTIKILRKETEQLKDKVKHLEKELSNTQEKLSKNNIKQNNENLKSDALMGRMGKNGADKRDTDSHQTDTDHVIQEQYDKLLTDLQERDKLLTKLQKEILDVTETSKEKEKVIAKLKIDLEKAVESTKNFHQLSEELQKTLKERQVLQQKVESLELELQNAKRNIETKSTGGKVATRSQLHSPVQDATVKSESEEIEKLRREIQRYRLELSNREGNFNRMFTESKPVRVDSRLGGFSMQRQKSDILAQTTQNHMFGNHISPRIGLEVGKKKTPEKRLPVLSMEGRAKTYIQSKQTEMVINNKSYHAKDRQLARGNLGGF